MQMLPNAPPGGGKDLLLAYALLVSKDYSSAAALLKGLDQGGAAFSEPVIPIMRAWTLIETGRSQEAAPLLTRNPTRAERGSVSVFLLSAACFSPCRGGQGSREYRGCPAEL